jgi:hypothetical protein
MVNRTFGAYSAFAEEKDERKDRKGRSILNATDEMANPYGLILSEQERDFIYGKLQTLDNWTNSLLGGRTGWRPQVKAALIATVELATAVIVAFLPGAPLHPHIGDGPSFVFFCIVAFVILQKLNLLLTHESIDDIHARRAREDEKEARERARYFRETGTKDLSRED